MAKIVALRERRSVPQTGKPASPPAPPKWLVEWATEQPLLIERTAVELALAAAESAAAPADPQLVAVEIELMAQQYSQQPGVPPKWSSVTTRFYLEAFEDVPFDLVQLALKRLRRSPLAFFPLPGQIRAHIAEDLAARNDTLRKARLALTRRRDPEPERQPPSEEDKAAVANLLKSAIATLAMPKERGDASRPMPAVDHKAVAKELAGYHLVDDDDPGLLARLREMDVDP